MQKKYFITGIGTSVGKTIASAILTEYLKADYWKPIQSGDLDKSDSNTIKQLITNKKTFIHPEKYRLLHPLSPHLSAKMEGVKMAVEDFALPITSNHLIVEGAGGLLVPINDKEQIIDLIKHLAIEVIVVSQNYLGSINHTLLTLAVLQQHKIPVKGIIFNGLANPESENYIIKYSGIKCIGKIPKLNYLSSPEIKSLTPSLTFDI